MRSHRKAQIREVVEIQGLRKEPRGYFTFVRITISIKFVIVFTRGMPGFSASIAD